MRRPHHLGFHQGLIDRVLLVALASLALACSDTETVLSVPGPPSGAAGMNGAGGSGEAPDDDAPLGPPEAPLPTVIAERALALLELRCVDCHGRGVAEGGLGDLPELTTLLSSGQIVPGAGAASPLMGLLQAQHPAMSRQRPFTIGELALLARFIDELATPAAPPCEPPRFMSHDAQLAALLADASNLSADVLPYTRYLTLTYASNAGLCGAALDRERYALVALINGVSTAPEIRVPVPIDERALLYRIDLRDYGWDRAIDLEDDGTVDFDDAWLAITAAAGDAATAFDGPEADELERLTQSRAAHLPVNAFVAAASRGDVYYALTAQRANIYETELELGIDIYEAFDSDNISLAGFSSRDRGVRLEFLAIRTLQARSTSLAYWTFGSFRRLGSASIFEDLFDTNFRSSQLIFHLPNGMLAFASAAVDGMRMAEGALACEGCAGQRGDFVAAGCVGCHDRGLLPIEDQVRPHVEDNPSAYNDRTLDVARNNYPTPAELDQILAGDNALYLAARERAGVPRDIPDPVSAAYFDFERSLTLRRAAAELGVPARDLQVRLSELGDPLQILAIPNGRIARAAFSAAYRSTLCALLTSAQNRPADCPAR